VRDLFSLQVTEKLRDCWEPPNRAFMMHGWNWNDRINCAGRWWKSREWSWRERDDRATEVGYRVWGLLLSLEQANADAPRESQPVEAR
jgi:hypothetical protein